MASQVTLRDGSKTSLALVTIVCTQLTKLQEENAIALWDLAMKCKDSSHAICPLPGCEDPVITLQRYELLNEKEQVISEDHKRIILNAIEDIDLIEHADNIGNLVLRNPTFKPQPRGSIPESSQWNWCVIL